MAAPDERVWLKNSQTGGFFECPAAAVDDWADLGWKPTDERPVVPNPATAEMPREWFEPIPAPDQVADQTTKPDDGASTIGSD